MKWPSLRDIVALRPSSDALVDSSQSEGAFSLLSAGDTTRVEPERQAADERRRRIRFDNAIRLWVAVPTFLTCVALRAGGAIDSLLPISLVIVAYAIAVTGIFTLFFNRGFSRPSDFILSGLDLVTMSFAVYYTGATASPLYFVYFVPVVIHAFHRDWNMILFSGFGGVVLYGISVLVSLHTLNSAAMADLCARLIFMLLTVAVACLALSVLRKEEERDRLRIARLRAISLIGDGLNRACSAAEARAACKELAPLISSGVSSPGSRTQLEFQSASRKHLPLRAAAAMSAARNEFSIRLEGDDAAGSIVVCTTNERAIASDDIQFLRFLAQSIALCLKRHQMIDELRHSNEMGTAAAAVYLAAGRSRRSGQMAFLEGALALLEADVASLYLWNGDRNRLEPTAWCGDGQPRGFLRSGHIDSIVSMAHETGTVRMEREEAGEPSDALAAPILLPDGRSIGVVRLERKTGERFSEDDCAMAAAFACRSAHALLTAAGPFGEVGPVQPLLAA